MRSVSHVVCRPLSANLQDLNMLVQTEGRERTRQEFTQLLMQQGFNQPSFHLLHDGPYHAIFATKEQ